MGHLKGLERYRLLCFVFTRAAYGDGGGNAFLWPKKIRKQAQLSKTCLLNARTARPALLGPRTEKFRPKDKRKWCGLAGPKNVPAASKPFIRWKWKMVAL